nr:ATP-binding cassette domain-containing protein [Methylomarinum sp. Ch1-1]MDP4523001.1 ATP-binding cassette domain-containing protein [Methylomarinum sp. Ch1-1]
MAPPPALRDISLRLRTGSVTALLGPDGAGKTTLLRLAAGLLLPDTGNITVFEHDSAINPTELHKLSGYMPQRFGLYEDLSVQENLTLYADLHGIEAAERDSRFAELTQMTGLAKFGSRLAGQLSGGMKQKLGLACTLVNRPRLLLLDEPSVGVDPVSRRELWHIIDELIGATGATVLLSTAYMDEAERCSDVVLLDQGQILMQGAPAQYHAKAAGRCFIVTSKTQSKRQLQRKLAATPGIIDASIQGEGVRVVIGDDAQAVGTTLAADAAELKIEPAPPRLEDVFVMLLRQRRDGGALSASGAYPGNDFVAQNGGEAVIDVVSADRWFGSFQAVKKLSFNVRQGEIFGLLGANGAGKTTTFRMLCGLLPPSGGQLRVAGVDLRRAAARARSRLGYMSQKFSLYGQLSVRQNLDFFSQAYGLSRQKRRARIDWALQQFDLSPFVDSSSGELPLGYQQRLALACALMHEPDILFLDEPTSGIDPLARREFWHRINDLAAQGVTILVTTHFMEEAEYCDRLLILCEGEILASGTPLEIKQQSHGSECSAAVSMEEAFIRLLEATNASA